MFEVVLHVAGAVQVPHSNATAAPVSMQVVNRVPQAPEAAQVLAGVQVAAMQPPLTQFCPAGQDRPSFKQLNVPPQPLS